MKDTEKGSHTDTERGQPIEFQCDFGNKPISTINKLLSLCLDGTGLADFPQMNS